MRRTKKPVVEEFKKPESQATFIEFARLLARAKAKKQFGAAVLIDKSVLGDPPIRFDEEIERRGLIYGPCVRIAL